MDLLQNPFYVLGTTPREDRQHLMAIADEKSLVGDADAVAEACSALTNPRKRLAAEVAWLPGLGPRPAAIRAQVHIPPLARANLLAAGLVRAVEQLSVKQVADWIVELAEVLECIDVESTMTLVNEERVVARFPEVTDDQAIETELGQRRRQFKLAINEALDKLSPATLVEAVTRAVKAAAQGGEAPVPVLIDDLMDSYENKARDFLEQEAKNLRDLITQIRTAVATKQSDAAVSWLIGKLKQVLRNWEAVAQPIQVSKHSRGLDHPASDELAREIRELAVEVFNEHGKIEVSQRLTALLQEVFAEIDEIAEQTTKDTHDLAEIAEQQALRQREAQLQAERWRQEVTYEAEWGVVFKDKIKISPEGVEWKGRHWPLESISRVRWGGTQHYVNGVPTGTTYKVFFGNERDGATLSLNKRDVYSQFIDRLWKAVGVRLLTQMLEGLREGERYRFGSAIVDDFGISLERRRYFSANERVYCRWTELAIENRAGSFYIARKNEDTVAILSYQDDDNVHVLEAALRVFWKRVTERLSSLLSQDD